MRADDPKSQDAGRPRPAVSWRCSAPLSTADDILPMKANTPDLA